jgi:hypothetical protein
MHTFLIIAIVSLWTLGINLATREGEILFSLKGSLTKMLGEKLTSPILGCPYCMPSVHGAIIVFTFHFLFGGFPLPLYYYLLQWLFVTAASSTVNYIFFNLIRILLGYAELFEQKEPCPEVKEIEYNISKNE